MSARHRVSILVAATSTAALLLAGCSSSGTIGQGSSTKHQGSSSAGSSGGVLGGSDSNADSTDGSSGGSSGGSSDSSGSSGGSGADDPGCVAAMKAIASAQQAQHSSDAKSAISGVQTSISQLHAASGEAKKPGVKKAIDKVAGDLQDILSQVQSGKQPSTSKALTDAQALADVCAA
jgi:hypothetical protein